MKLRRIIICIISCLLLSGCIEKEILDEIYLLTGLGFDLLEDGQIRGTALVPIYESDQTIRNVTFVDVAEPNKDFVSTAQKQASDPIVIGSLESVVINEELAKNGILELLDSFQREAAIGTNLYLMISEGEAREILQGQYGQRSTAAHLTSLIEQNMNRRDLPQTNLHVFLNDYYREGKNPNLPIILKHEDKVKINGVGIFNEAKLAMKLPIEDLFFFKLLVDSYTLGVYEMELSNGENVVLKSIRSKRNFIIEGTKESPKISIKLKVNASLREYSGEKVGDKEVKMIEKDFTERIERETTRLIKRFQEENLDPVGFGYNLKTRTRGFDYKKWKDQYPNVPITVSAEVTVIERGVID